MSQKQRFVGSLLQRPAGIPPLWFNFGPAGLGSPRSEVIDGKQRLTSVLEWLDGSFEAICPCGEHFSYGDCDTIGKRHLGVSTTLSINFVSLARRDALSFYLALNTGGTVHSESDLQKVRDLLALEIEPQS